MIDDECVKQLQELQREMILLMVSLFAPVYVLLTVILVMLIFF